MTDDKAKPDQDEALDDADVTEDLEIKDAEEADAVKGGSTFQKLDGTGGAVKT